jgi:serine/threonine-protein kinase
MAEVYLAAARGQLGFQKLVVIKRLRAHFAEDTSIVEMFIDEARLAAQINHPNVVHTYEVVEHAGSYFIAMEYLDGQPLNRILSELSNVKRALPPALAVRVASDALAGLHYAHELTDYSGHPLDLVHRDVSPHNVFVTYDGQVKVVDFGIAKAASSRTQTEVGILKGKLGYMSPEQARAESVDRRSDIFSLGIVMWEMLTGHRLFANASAAASLNHVLQGPIASPRQLVPGLDPGLEAIVMRALARPPGARFQTAHEMREALDAWAVRAGATSRQDELGRLVQDTFREAREQVKRQIQRYMAPAADGLDAPDEGISFVQSPSMLPGIGSDASPAPDLELDRGGSGRRSSGSGHASGPSPNAAAVEGTNSAVAAESSPTRRKFPRGALIALGALAGAALLTVVALGMRTRGETTQVPVLYAAPVTASGSAAAADEPAPTSSISPVATSAPPASFSERAPVATIPRRGLPAAVMPHPPLAAAPPNPPSASPGAPAPAVNEPGFLTLDTYPWTRVSEGGRVLGDTPLIRVSLSPGPHTLSLDNAEQGIHQTYSVTIRGGESVSRRLGLK